MDNVRLYAGVLHKEKVISAAVPYFENIQNSKGIPPSVKQMIGTVPSATSVMGEGKDFVKKAVDTGAKAFETMLMECYGFGDTDAALVQAPYNRFMNDPKNEELDDKDQAHKYFSNISALCANYDGSGY